MKRRLLIILIACSGGLGSCLAPAQKRLATTNDKIKLDLLFEVDSCKVYRFRDGAADFHYLTICKKR